MLAPCSTKKPASWPPCATPKPPPKFAPPPAAAPTPKRKGEPLPAVDARCGGVGQVGFFGWRKSRGQAFEGVPQHRVAAGHLGDREIGRGHTTAPPLPSHRGVLEPARV